MPVFLITVDREYIYRVNAKDENTAINHMLNDDARSVCIDVCTHNIKADFEECLTRKGGKS